MQSRVRLLAIVIVLLSMHLPALMQRVRDSGRPPVRYFLLALFRVLDHLHRATNKHFGPHMTSLGTGLACVLLACSSMLVTLSLVLHDRKHPRLRDFQDK